MGSAWSPAGSPVVANFAKPPRGGSTGNIPSDPVKVQSISYSTSWGVNPGQGNITYVSPGNFPAEAKITAGAFIKLVSKHGHLMVGIVQKDEPIKSSGGHSRALTFVDFRDYLQWDDIYCCFNLEDKTIVNGRRVKRYKHLFPHDFDEQRWYYTDYPFVAADILKRILIPLDIFSIRGDYLYGIPGNPTVESPWWIDDGLKRPLLHRWWNTATNEFTFYGIQTELDTTGRPMYPALNFTWEGVKLGAALVELCDRQGLTFTLEPWETETDSFYYRLHFAMLGEGDIPTYQWRDDNDVIYLPDNDDKYFPPNSDDRRMGKSLSGNATRIRLLGGRNLFQVYNVPLLRDWPLAWNQYFDVSLVAEKLANRATRAAAGTPAGNYLATSTGHMVGWQNAMSIVETMTVRQFIDFLGDYTLVDPNKWHGRNRMEMPVALYIKEILFRAFRTTPLINCPSHSGVTVPRRIDYLTIVPENLSTIGYYQQTFDDRFPTLPMYPVYNDPYVPNGSGMVLVRGYQIGQETWKLLRPENFNLSNWRNVLTMWQPIGFTIDDNGDGTQRIYLDQPVYMLDDFFNEVNGPTQSSGGPVKLLVPNKNAYPTRIPQVIATLTFAAERYSRWRQTRDYKVQKRDATEVIPSLYGEYVVYNNGWSEVLYSDGMSVDDKADRISYALINKQFTYYDGGFTKLLKPGDTPTELVPTYNRIGIEYGPQGFTEEIQFTNERGRLFQPERDFDRWRKEERLFAGQQDLIESARQHKAMAIGFAQSPQFANYIWNTYYNNQINTTPVNSSATP